MPTFEVTFDPDTFDPDTFGFGATMPTEPLPFQPNTNPQSEAKETENVLNRLLDSLLTTISSQAGQEGIQLRTSIGDVRANFRDYFLDGTFAENLLECFKAAQTANVTLASLVRVRLKLFEEAPVGNIPKAIVQSAIGFCLALESRIISNIEFTCRNDVETMISTMQVAFGIARDLAADALDSKAYRDLVALSGALTSYLATTARPLPRMVTFKLAVEMPALVLSNRVYYVADRSEEIVAENRIVHPAFCPREIRGLAS